MAATNFADLVIILIIFTLVFAMIFASHVPECAWMRENRMTKAQKRAPQLESLALDELIDVRERADKLIAGKLVREKRALQQKLARIETFEMRQSPAELSGAAAEPRKTRRKVIPKYRDPVSGATWSGRGKIPRWMTPLLQRGARREDFRIGGD